MALRTRSKRTLTVFDETTDCDVDIVCQPVTRKRSGEFYDLTRRIKDADSKKDSDGGAGNLPELMAEWIIMHVAPESLDEMSRLLDDGFAVDQYGDIVDEINRLFERNEEQKKTTSDGSSQQSSLPGTESLSESNRNSRKQNSGTPSKSVAV